MRKNLSRRMRAIQARKAASPLNLLHGLKPFQEPPALSASQSARDALFSCWTLASCARPRRAHKHQTSSAHFLLSSPPATQTPTRAHRKLLTRTALRDAAQPCAVLSHGSSTLSRISYASTLSFIPLHHHLTFTSTSPTWRTSLTRPTLLQARACQAQHVGHHAAQR